MKLRNYQTELINQTRDAFRHGYKKVLAVLPCGAGKTICFAQMCQNHVAKNVNNYVWFLVHRQELIQQTVETFKKIGISMDNVLIGMVQSVSNHLERYHKPTMIIFDEAHHATSKTWNKVIEAFPDVSVVGLTATPCRLDGTPLGSIFETMVVGVGSEYLMDNNYLCNYDYYAPKTNIADGEFKAKGSDYDMEDVTDQMEKAKIYGDIISKVDLTRKTIIYAPSIKFSLKLVRNINNYYGRDVAVHFDGNTPDKERKFIIEEFRRGNIRILVNVDLIGEGFDVPDCDCVFLLRPTKSTALYIQQSMRCLRPNGNKRAVIYDFVGNVFRHGMPTDHRDWSLDSPMRMRNRTNNKELLVRQCHHCFRVYKGINPICSYCDYNNGKTQAEIEQEKQVELERIEAVERKKHRIDQGRARSLEELIQLGKQRGYKNPYAWANFVYKGRKQKYSSI